MILNNINLALLFTEFTLFVDHLTLVIVTNIRELTFLGIFLPFLELHFFLSVADSALIYDELSALFA